MMKSRRREHPGGAPSMSLRGRGEGRCPLGSHQVPSELLELPTTSLRPEGPFHKPGHIIRQAHLEEHQQTPF